MILPFAFSGGGFPCITNMKTLPPAPQAAGARTGSNNRYAGSSKRGSPRDFAEKSK